jgi:hypothetical protein
MVRGTTSDNGTVKKVTVNGQEAKVTVSNFAQWEVALDSHSTSPLTITARSEDAAGNVEQRPHVVVVPAEVGQK